MPSKAVAGPRRSANSAIFPPSAEQLADQMADAPTDLARFPERAVFPEGSPQVCVTFFTCAGTGISGAADLQHAYPAAVTFLDAQRNARGAATLPLRYELVWLDNGREEGVQEAFIRRGAQFERVLRNPTNQGLFRAVNDVRSHPSTPDTPRLVLARHTFALQVWFRGRGCRAPYVLNLEDDRVARLPAAEHTTPSLFHVHDAIELLLQARLLPPPITALHPPAPRACVHRTLGWLACG